MEDKDNYQKKEFKPFENESKIDSKYNKSNLALITGKTYGNKFIIDSGSSCHISNDKNLFSKLEGTDSHVTIANGHVVNSHGCGEVVLKTETDKGEMKTITLQNVLYVPDLETNLVSVTKATENGCTVIFEKNKCYFKYNNEIYLEGEVKNNLYEIINVEPVCNEFVNMAYNCKNKNCVTLWHKRLGHKNFTAMQEIIKNDLAVGITIDPCKHDTTCVPCLKTKLPDMPYPKQAMNRANRVLQLVHSDLCGPFKTPSIGGKSYFMTLIDDYSRFTMIYLISNKNEVLAKLKDFTAMVYNKFGRKPERIRTDNGGEYVGHEVENFLRENGIQHELTVPFCPSQNGVAERRNRTLLEMTKAMLAEANLPHKFWGEAVNTANYLINRLPTKFHGRSPYELWYEKRPNYSYLKVFGCKAFVYIDKHKRGKLDDKAEEGIFVGYDSRSAGYRIYTGGKNIVIARTVKFLENLNVNTPNENENEYLNDNKFPQSEGILEIELENNAKNSEETGDIDVVQPRRSTRTNIGVPPDRLIYLTKYDPIVEPQSWSELQEITNPVEKENWLQATQREMKSLDDNNTWTLVDPPQGKKVIGSRWLFKAKYDERGEVHNFKARLVAKGYLQKFGDDFDETFAPVVSFTTIRTFLNAAAYKKLKINQIDIKTAFLHGDLEEEVYMLQPEGYVVPGKENKVCLLNKALYGLKQAARAWNLKISKSLKRLNYIQSTADPCLYVKNDSTGTSYIIIYVDDLLIAGSDEEIDETIQALRKEYDLKNLGEVSYYLGIKIERINENEYRLNQKLKIEELVKKLNLENCKPTYIPMDPSYIKLDDNDNLLPNNKKFRQTIGSLLYISTITRPDILVAVNLLSRRNENPREKDWEALKRVVRYLSTTKNLSLYINTKQPPILTCYADADWAGDVSNRKSTSGNLFKLGNNPIQWISKRQTCVALSSAEAEYVSASSASQELVCLIKLLEEMNLQQELPIKMYEDNISCIKMLDSEKHFSRTKHIEVKYHHIRNLKENGIIDLEYCSTENMTADVFTKPVPKPIFEKHRHDLQLHHPALYEAQGEC